MSIHAYRCFVAAAVALLAATAAATSAVQPRVIQTKYACDDYVVASVVATDPEYRADPTGGADCTAAVQSAIDDVSAAGGGTVFLPSGRYRFDGGVRLKAGVTLRGDWKAPSNGLGGLAVAGTILEPVGDRGHADAVSFITMEGAACVRNLSIWYPDQTIDNVTPYPWTISTECRHGSNNFTVKNVTLVNPYAGIRIGVQMMGLSLMHNIYGTPLSTGISLDGTADTPRMALIHFGPQYWLGSGLGPAPDPSVLKKYLFANGTGLDLMRADGLDVYRAVIEGYAVGVRSHRSRFGNPYGAIFGLKATGCDIGFLIDEINTGWQLTHCTLAGATAAIWAKTGFRVQLQLNDCRLVSAKANALRSDGDGNIQAQNCSINGRVVMDGGGSISLLACTLDGAASRVVIGPKVLRALILGGIQKSSVENDGLGDVQVDPTPIKSTTPGAPPAEWVADRRPSTPRLFNVTECGASSAGLAVPSVDSTVAYSAGDADYRQNYSDNTASFQTALDRAGKAGGGTVYVPAGLYYFKGCLRVPSGVELRGCSDGPHHPQSAGSILLPTAGRGQEKGTPFITLAPNSGARGLTIVYPDQKIDTITPYPWTFRATGPRCWLMDCAAANSYQLADFGSFESSGHLIRCVEGTPLRRGLWVSQGSGEVDSCHVQPNFWLFLYKGAPTVWSTGGVTYNEAQKALSSYVNEHEEPFVFGSCPQTLQINNAVCTTGIGLRFAPDSDGASGGWVINHESDGATIGLRVDASSPDGLELDNTILANYSPFDSKIPILASASSRGTLRLFNGLTWGLATGSVVDLRGNGSTTLQSWHFGQNGEAVRILGGSATLQGLQCGEAPVNVASAGHVTRLEVDGSSARGGQFTCPAASWVHASGNSGAVAPTPLTSRLHIGIEPNEAQPAITNILSQGVTSTACQIASGEGRSRSNGLLITASPSPGVAHSAVIFSLFDSLNLPIFPMTVFRYWLRPESITGRKVALALEFADGSSLDLSGLDTYGRLLHPATARGAVGQWTMVETLIGPSCAGKSLKRIRIIFDDYEKLGVDCKAVVDDIEFGEPLRR